MEQTEYQAMEAISGTLINAILLLDACLAMLFAKAYPPTLVEEPEINACLINFRLLIIVILFFVQLYSENFISAIHFAS